MDRVANLAEVRELGRLSETIHAVVYFGAETTHAYASIGLNGFWRGYFASRAAAVELAEGPRVSADRITALFGGFAPAMVGRAIPAVWDTVRPADVQAARLEAAAATLRRLTGPSAARALPRIPLPPTSVLRERPLAWANANLPDPGDPVIRLWQCCTILREYRGDGHLSALSEAGLVWPQPHLLLASTGALDARQQAHRGWSDEEWADAREDLRARGLLGREGVSTTAGRELLAAIETRTDEYAADAFADVDGPELAAALRPIATLAAPTIPYPNAMGLPDVR